MSRHEALAQKLWDSETNRKAIQPFSLEFGSKIEDAYQIQCSTAQLRLSRGEKLVGYKIGLTSLEAQKHFGISHPDFGHLFESMEIKTGSKVNLNELIQPKIEAEIAFMMGADLKGPGVTYEQAKRAVAYVCAALEIIDSRFENWKIGAFDTIADNGSSARFVLGETRMPLSELDLPHLGMALSKNNEVQLTAAGAAVMGDPIQAVCFLANELARVGKCLEKGQIVLSGSLGGMLTMEKGTIYSAEILKLGKVWVS